MTKKSRHRDPSPPPGRVDHVQRIIDVTCVVLGHLHAWLARLFSAATANLWRWQNRLTPPLKFSVLFLLLAVVLVGVATFMPLGYFDWAGWGDDLRHLLDRSGHLVSGMHVRIFGIAGACASLLAAVVAWRRGKWTLWLLKAVLAFVLLVWFKAFAWTLSAPAALHAADFRMFDATSKNALWTASFAYGGLGLLLPVIALLLLARVDTLRWYTGQPIGRKLIGDRFVESVRTGGVDPRFRTSGYWAWGLFFAVVVAPFLIRGCGSEEPYGLVKGDGAVEVEVVTVKKIKRPDKKKLLVNVWSPYIFDRMKIDDSDVLKNLLEETMDTYAVQSSEAAAKSGKKGKKAGWPEGMENATVRFIRLKYSGGDWDQDMGLGADFNLLVNFNQVTGFPIARDTEAVEISRLRRFPKKKAPPFVFMTGSGNIGLSDNDVKALRWYLEKEAGLLFIDNGGGHFDRSVRSILARVFPGRSIVDIPNDDPIYQAPYVFPNGAPPFWHHAGTRALGVKVDGRWAVFYHPGDINDAWKDGHSGAKPEVAAQAYKLGINVMFYAFNAYYQRHYETENK